MKNEIKNIYNTLSGGKVILNENFTLSRNQFNSISIDRFISELKKRGIKWDGNDILFSDLINQKIENSISEIKLYSSEPNANFNSSIPNISSGHVGIDIQQIDELPDSTDFWENDFYISKFHREEIAYCVSKDNPKQSFAGLYSCKEALIKCDCTLNWDHINITHNENGKPQFHNYNISISHSGLYAISIAFKLNLESNSTIKSEEHVSETTITDYKYKNDITFKNTSIIILYSMSIIILLYIIYRDFVIK